MAEGTIKTGDWNLLWTNPSPNSSFAQQTLNIDGVGNYSEYAVIFKGTPASSMEQTTYFLKPSGNFMLFGYVLYPIRRTECFITENTISLGKGSGYESTGYSEDNKYYIPLRLYAR